MMLRKVIASLAILLLCGAGSPEGQFQLGQRANGGTAPPPCSPATAPGAPLAYWPLCANTTSAASCGSGSFTSTSALDESGNGFTATIAGTQAGSNGFYSAVTGAPNSWSFFSDGSASTITTASPVDSATTGWTLTEWVYFRSLPLNGELLYNGNSGANGLGFAVGNGACASGSNITVLAGGQSCSRAGSFSAVANTWYFLALTNSSSSPFITFYVNATQIGTGAGSATPTTQTAPLTSPIAVDLNNARVYNSALTAANICYLYANKL